MNKARAWLIRNCRFAKQNVEKRLDQHERNLVREKFGDDPGCTFAKDDDGYYCHTHRARSDSYESIEDIPQGVVDFIESTG